jgi:hypothetical protein
VTKDAVATGADLVAYGPFSISNYLKQPYNSDLDFGTGDFCWMFWLKGDGNIDNDNYIFSRSPSSSFSGAVQYAYIVGSTDKLRWRISDDGDSTREQLETSVTISSSWQHICLVRRSSTFYLYYNGSLDKSTAVSNASGSLSNTSAELLLGNHPSLGSSLEGNDISLGLFRASATAPSPEQIKKIYEDEKMLFQENAQATLYGSSDSVTALAYDDDTNLLHAGTSAGRSVFSGLRRVDNTTDAVGSAISASNGMVADD